MHIKNKETTVSLFRATTKKLYANLDPKSDNRKFWKHVKPFFFDKTPINNNITLLEEEEIVTDNVGN